MTNDNASNKPSKRKPSKRKPSKRNATTSKPRDASQGAPHDTEKKHKRRAAHNIPGVGQRITFTVTETDEHGHGCGTHPQHGYAIAGRGAFVGDEVKARVERRWLKARHVQARTLEVVRASDARVETHCAHGLSCAGCPLEGAHRDYSLAFKTARIEGALNAADIDAPVDFPLAAEDLYGQRERAKLTAGRDRGAQFRLGLYAPQTHDFYAATQCPYFVPAIRETVGALERALNAAGAKAFGADGEGLKAVHARAYRDGVRVLVLGDADLEPHVFDVFQAAYDNGDVVGVCEHVDDEKSNRIVGGQRRRVLGTPSGTPLSGGPDEDIAAFCQSIGHLAAQMYDQAATYLCGEGERAIDERELWDAYAGTGGFSRALSTRGASHVTAVETDAVALETLREAGVNIENKRTDEALAAALAQSKRVDGIVLDPPRKGLGAEVCEQLLTLAPERMVVVFCHPDAITKDLTRLTPAYDVERILPVDLFAGSAQIEAMAFLRRRDGATEA